jgi:hypothetical protein
LPCCFRIFVDRLIQALDQTPGEIRALLLGQGKRFFEQFLGFLHHELDYVPGRKTAPKNECTASVFSAIVQLSPEVVGQLPQGGSLSIFLPAVEE